MADKKIVQRNLLLSMKYTLLGSFHTEEPTICDNCGVAISNVATIKDQAGSCFSVGLDCASTLAGIQHTIEFRQAEYAMKEAKAARAAIRKRIKSGATVIQVKTFKTAAANFYREVGAGCWTTDPNNARSLGYASKMYPAAVWQKWILPSIKDLITCEEESDR